jgi:tetratricopeptide (TPR) repeat protein
VALLGEPTNPIAVQDESVRCAAQLTRAEICFCLAFRNVHLAAELGRPDLFEEAARAAFAARRTGLSMVIRDIASVARADVAGRVPALGALAQTMARFKQNLEPWLLMEIAGKSGAWIQELESALMMGDNAVTLAQILPPFYEALQLPDAAARKERLLERAIRFLIKNRRHTQALEILKQIPDHKPEVEAECLEAVGEFRRAAEIYRNLGKLKEALSCYRSIPDFEAAAALIREIGAHPAAQAYEWVEKLRRVLNERPENFNRIMQPSEKKILEGLLEQALGVARKQPAARKTTRKTALKSTSAKKRK